MNARAWHTLSDGAVAELLHSNLRWGLTEDAAARRLRRVGRNVLPEGQEESILSIFLRQFQSPLIYLLLAAGAIVVAIGEINDGIIIFSVMTFNAVVGAFQEGKAQSTLRALRKFAKSTATVLRGNRVAVISDEEVVPGDVILLQEGTKIPADARIIKAYNLQVDESALTGESEPVHKLNEVLADRDLPVADRRNMVFKGTYVVSGRGKAIVVATGIHTEIGKISKAVVGLTPEIPLKRNITKLSRIIVLFVVGVGIIAFLAGIALGFPLVELFLTVVALAVAVVPEGLPVALTLILAVGVWHMARRNALVKRLQAVEALGEARVIAVDKTGTLTRNEMVIRRVYTAGRFFDVGGEGYTPKGQLFFEGRKVHIANHPELVLAARIAAFCANAEAVFSKDEKVWRITGDPTEVALDVFARKLGISKEELEREAPLYDEIPFSYNSKQHVTAHMLPQSAGGGQFVTVVGAPEVVLQKAKKVIAVAKRGDPQKLISTQFDAYHRSAMQEAARAMARDGLRTVAFAFAELPPEGDIRKGFGEVTIAGIFGMSDSIRKEAARAVKKAQEGGIRVVMITGDHRDTAVAIARRVGIYHKGDAVMTGRELRCASQDELVQKLDRVTVFARVAPEDKMRIVNGYRARGEIVAMTGDGVNDAPSLTAADLGVAMGRIGTEVAKEAADIVLLDDNFSSIVAAVEEGRNIFVKLRKVVLYLFTTALTELLVIIIALFSGIPLPLLPVQILWLNVVTDSFPVLALAFGPREDNLLSPRFYKGSTALFDFLTFQRMLLMVAVMTLGTVAAFVSYQAVSIEKATTMALTVLAVFEWLNVWNVQSETKSIVEKDIAANKSLIAAVGGVLLFHLAALYIPFMNALLHTVPLSASDWVVAISLAFSVIVVEEIRKLITRKVHNI
ncbi:HAD family hydrolase [Candidatus Parcubacteria bacterium]|nr:MAG: HAD family hydrolase [Candidatus Parcubacteria bacterium]